LPTLAQQEEAILIVERAVERPYMGSVTGQPLLAEERLGRAFAKARKADVGESRKCDCSPS